MIVQPSGDRHEFNEFNEFIKLTNLNRQRKFNGQRRIDYAVCVQSVEFLSITKQTGRPLSSACFYWLTRYTSIFFESVQYYGNKISLCYFGVGDFWRAGGFWKGRVLSMKEYNIHAIVHSHSSVNYLLLNSH